MPLWLRTPLPAAGAGALLVGGMWVAPVLLHGSFSGATLGVFCVYRIFEPLYYILVIVLLIIRGALVRDLPHPPHHHRCRPGLLHRALVD